MAEEGGAGPDEEVWLKLEPPILALVCSGEAAAVRVMNLSRGAAGLKRCFISSVRGEDRGHVLAVSDTRRLESLLWAGGKKVASDEYVGVSVAVANRKLRESRERMERLRKAIEDNPDLD